MSASLDAVPSDPTILQTNSGKLGPFYEVTFTQLNDGISAQYSAPRATFSLDDHPGAEKAPLTGLTLVFKDLQTTWNAVQDRTTGKTPFTPEDIEKALSVGNVRFWTMVPPETSRVFNIPTCMCVVTAFIAADPCREK